MLSFFAKTGGSHTATEKACALKYYIILIRRLTRKCHTGDDPASYCDRIKRKRFNRIEEQLTCAM